MITYTTKGEFILNNLYAIHGGESLFSVIKANSKEDAFDVFASNQIADKVMHEYISEFKVDDSLLEKFYQDNDGHFWDMQGNLPERIRKLDKDQQQPYINSWIEKNVNDFWSDKPHFAAEYLKEFYKSYNSNGFYSGKFSDDFWVDTIKKIIQQDNWYEDFKIVKIDLTNDNYQLIYRS